MIVVRVSHTLQPAYMMNHQRRRKGTWILYPIIIEKPNAWKCHRRQIAIWGSEL
tara:strand:- start:2617 stop:2778 length:162 start_codon:yes stop_codon:yes gene_type:complete